MDSFPSTLGRLALAILLPAQLMAMGGCTSTVHSTANLKAKILAINDFHGQVGEGKTTGKSEYNKTGSAPVLAAYLKNAQAGMEDRSFVVSVGDLVGASPAVSALLQDEPTVMFMNTLANEHCREPMHPRCNIVATVGNHEFDEGAAELKRLIYGGNHDKGPFIEDPYTGARYPYVAANVKDKATGKTLLPPYVIKTVDGVQIAFIGAVVKNVPSIVSASRIAGIAFSDEADSINRLVPELREKGVRAIVAFIHQGGSQPPYPGRTDPRKPLEGTKGDMKTVTDIVSRLDGEVDVVLTAHTHRFTNALLKNGAGKEVLVTQAYSAGTAFADIDLEIDPISRDVVGKSVSIITTWAEKPDGKPAVMPDPAAAEILAKAEKAVGPKVNKVISSTDRNVTRFPNRAGESVLGNLVADAMRRNRETDCAFMNPGGLRADLAAGPSLQRAALRQPGRYHAVDRRADLPAPGTAMARSGISPHAPDLRPDLCLDGQRLPSRRDGNRGEKGWCRHRQVPSPLRGDSQFSRHGRRRLQRFQGRDRSGQRPDRHRCDGFISAGASPPLPPPGNRASETDHEIVQTFPKTAFYPPL